jgi:ferric-dicitrate binding protein FerR (iron transport regulator)
MSAGEALDPQVAELLSALLDGAVTPEERAIAEAWLERSPEARAEYASLAQVKAALGGLGEVEVPFGFFDRMLAQGTPQPVVTSALDRAAARRASWRGPTAVVISLVASAAAFVVVGGAAGADRPVRPPIEAVAAGDADGLIAVRSDEGPVRALRQEAGGVAWSELPEGLRRDEDGAEIWEDLTTGDGEERVIVFRDGVVVTVFAEGADVDELVDEALEIVDEQPASDDGLLDRVGDAFDSLLESLSLD